MAGDNSVVFKGNRDGILIILDDDIEYDELKERLKKKARESSDFFDGVSAAITFKGRDLSDIEENELINIIAKNSNMNVRFVVDKNVQNEKTQKFEDALNSNRDNNSVKFYVGSLRGGQSIEFDGSVIVIGDVNPNAEIIAKGNIIVVGRLKGFAHAGCAGNTEAFIVALSLQPTQLRISELIIYLPTDIRQKILKRPYMAFVNEGEIALSEIGNGKNYN